MAPRAYSGLLDRCDGARLAISRGPCRLSLFECVNDGQPAFPCCGDAQERREPPAASAARREHVEPGGMGRVRGPPQEPGGDHGLERLRDLRELIPDVLGQTLAEEVGPRMPREEQQQIEIAWVPQAPDTVKEIPDSLWRHGRSRSMLALPRGRKGPNRQLSREHSLPFREPLDVVLRHRL